MTVGEQQDASMFQKRTIDPARLSPARSLELLKIFVKPRLDFYRQPIIEEKEVEPAPEQKKLPKTYGFGVGAELMEARATQPAVLKKEKGPQAIYGSVSTNDVLMAVRAAMAVNDEARMVVLREEDVNFVGLDAQEGADADRVKHVGEFTVELKVRGGEGSVSRTGKVIAQEAT